MWKQKIYKTKILVSMYQHEFELNMRYIYESRILYKKIYIMYRKNFVNYRAYWQLVDAPPIICNDKA